MCCWLAQVVGDFLWKRTFFFSFFAWKQIFFQKLSKKKMRYKRQLIAMLLFNLNFIVFFFVVDVKSNFSSAIKMQKQEKAITFLINLLVLKNILKVFLSISLFFFESMNKSLNSLRVLFDRRFYEKVILKVPLLIRKVWWGKWRFSRFFCFRFTQTEKLQGNFVDSYKMLSISF